MQEASDNGRKKKTVTKQAPRYKFKDFWSKVTRFLFPFSFIGAPERSRKLRAE